MKNIVLLIVFSMLTLLSHTVFADIQSVADDLFWLVDLNQAEMATVKSYYDAGQYQEALDAFRDYFIDQMGTLPMGDMPSANSSADNLMANQVTIYNLAGGYETQTIGAPGSVDWYLVTNFEHWTYYLSNLGWMSPLITRFAENPAANVAYLEKWAAFCEDFAVNNYDQWSAIFDTPDEELYGGLFRNIWLHRLVLGDRIRYFLAQLAAAAQADAALCKTAISGEQLGLILTEMADQNNPRLEATIHGGVPNQVISSALGLIRAGLAMDMFKDASAWLSTGEYEAQDYLVASYMPDGTDMEQSFNYNGALIGVGEELIELYQALGSMPGWVSDYEIAMLYRYRFLAAMVRPNGMLPGLDLQSDSDAESRLTDHQSYFNDVLGGQIIDHTWSYTPTEPLPAFESIAYPYGGYYIIRDGWDGNANHLFMKGSRRPMGHYDESANQVQVTAYGRTMLIDSGGSLYVTDYRNGYFHDSFGHNTVIVDGYSQQMGGTQYPAYTTPTDNRWHESMYFNFAEGAFGNGINGGYGPDAITVTDVKHRREVSFLREFGCYIITDRLDSSSSHTYTQIWNFDKTYAKEEVNLGSVSSIVTSAPFTPNVAIHNFYPNTLSYTRYYNYYDGVNVFGWAKDGSGYVPAVDTHRSWTASGNDVLVTLIIPMARQDDGIASLTSTTSGQLRGFAATMDDGSTVKYSAGIANGTITMDNITVTADSLLVTTSGSTKRGLVLGCSAMSINSVAQTVSSADFEFTITGGVLSEVSEISTPQTFEWVEAGDEVYPVYYERPVVLTVEANPPYVDSLVPTAGSYQYTAGSVAALSADDYLQCPYIDHFDHWQVDEQFYSYDRNISLTMDADKTATAVFLDARTCGDECHPRPTGDFSGDCIVDLADLLIMANEWMTVVQ